MNYEITGDEIEKILTANEIKEGFILGELPKDAQQDEEKLFCILYKDTIIATKKRQSVTADWIHKEIENYKIKEGLMSFESRKIIKIIRGILWITSFYILGLLIKIVSLFPYQKIDLNTKENILGISIFLGSFIIMGILYESREEDKLRKQIVNIISVIIGIMILYFLCCLLVYLIHGEWAVSYLWF